MTPLCAFGLGVAIGAWTVPLANLLADRITGRHYLAIKETP